MSATSYEQQRQIYEQQDRVYDQLRMQHLQSLQRMQQPVVRPTSKKLTPVPLSELISDLQKSGAERIAQFL